MLQRRSFGCFVAFGEKVGKVCSLNVERSLRKTSKMITMSYLEGEK